MRKKEVVVCNEVFIEVCFDGCRDCLSVMVCVLVVEEVWLWCILERLVEISKIVVGRIVWW